VESSDPDFWHVFHRSRTPMLLFDERRRYTDVNEAACQCFGLRREELLRLRSGDRTPSDLQRRVDELRPRLQAGEPITAPWTYLHADGSRRETYVHLHPNAIDGKDLLILLNAPPTVAGGGLTPREREITALLADGCDGREIAERLVLSPETVRTHIRNAMERTNARTRAHLIAIALRDRLIDS
jgi:PAS domain S-box-containing protein